MGAGGRHWGLLVQKFRVGACAGADGKGSIQNAARLDSSQEAEEPGSDQKVLFVEYEVIKGEGEGSEPVVPETDLLDEPEKVSCCLLDSEGLDRSRVPNACRTLLKMNIFYLT